MSNKERLDMDNLFKALLIIILVAFLYLYYENMDNNRFYYLSKPGSYIIDIRLLDTKTGQIYNYENPIDGEDFYYIHDLPNATMKRIK